MYAPGATRGQLHKTSGAADYQALATMCVRMAMTKRYKAALAEHKGQLIVRYWFHLGQRDSDCSNLIKALEDAIAHELRVNDSRFLPQVIAKTTGHQHPHTIVEVLPV